MYEYHDPILRARLTEAARQKTKLNRTGRDGMHTEHQIGMTNIHIEKGNMFASIAWGIDGLDSPLSKEVEPFAEHFEITADIRGHRAPGIYILRGSKKDSVLARARVCDHPHQNDRDGKKSQTLVSAAKRADVVRLFELIRDGKIRPDAEHTEFQQIEGALGKLRRLERLVPTLEARVKTKQNLNVEVTRRLNEVKTQLAAVQRFAAAA